MLASICVGRNQGRGHVLHFGTSSVQIESEKSSNAQFKALAFRPWSTLGKLLALPR